VYWGQKIKELHIIHIAGYYLGAGRFLKPARRDLFNGKMHGQSLAKQKGLPDAPSREFLRVVRIYNCSVLKR
jgi:hypothetical protein